MSSLIFQPLLHDPLGWKPSKSTYVDHYRWKKYRTTSKDKKLSTYGQQLQRQLPKQQATQYLPLTSNGEQPINPVIVVNKNEDHQQPPPSPSEPISYRYSLSKTPVYIAEYNQRPVSADENKTSNSKASQRPITAPAAVEEKTRPVTTFDTRPLSKEEKEKPPVDPNNDSSRHWLTYPNPRTPQYIIDIKQRLGQLRVPSTLTRPVSASVRQRTPQSIDRPSSASTQQKQQTNDDQHDFLTYHTRDTPDELRATRYRMDKNRYHASLDNYPPRPQTCPVRTNETAKPVTPQESGNEQFSSPSFKNDVWIVDEEKKSPMSDYESSSILIQMVDCDGLPTEYVDALETANAAQEEYQRNLKMNGERRRPESTAYRLSENKNESFVAYQNHQQSTGMNNQLRQVARSAHNNFGVWVRNATEKERASAMKILQDVLNQPVVGYENQTKQKPVFKQAPAPPPVRTSSATRKLGRTRTQHQFPCEICEKLLIKRHVWDLSGSETLTCPHHPQGIQVRSE